MSESTNEIDEQETGYVVNIGKYASFDGGLLRGHMEHIFKFFDDKSNVKMLRQLEVAAVAFIASDVDGNDFHIVTVPFDLIKGVIPVCPAEIEYTEEEEI